MDLASPLRSIAPTLDSAVLEVLAGTESGMGVGHIARLARHGTRQGLTLALERLVEQGLVLAQPANRGYLYRLNRDHVLAESILSASRARLAILARLSAAAAELTPSPLHVSVFGSFARREAGSDSDIDVLLVLASGAALDDAWYRQLRDLGDRVMAWTGNRMEYLALTLDGLGETVAGGEGIVDSWLQDCVTVFGTPIEGVVADARAMAGSRSSGS